ncbi:MAG: hypothetical protein ABL904_20585 [Hyphomicrobiaceae bacterium]
MKHAPKTASILSGLMLAGLLTVSPAAAQEKKPEAVGTSIPVEELTPEEKAEREARKACKVAICAVFHNRKSEGPDVSCSVLKTWRKEQLDKMMSKAKVSWPWGRVKCVADVKLKRADLIKGMTETKYEAQLGKHEVKCEVERDKEAKADINFDFSPKVTFEKGKATKAHLNWGKIEAPALVKGAMWTATATDNTFNVLQGTIVEDINDFIGKKCEEVKDDWAGK